MLEAGTRGGQGRGRRRECVGGVWAGAGRGVCGGCGGGQGRDVGELGRGGRGRARRRGCVWGRGGAALVGHGNGLVAMADTCIITFPSINRQIWPHVQLIF